MKKFLFFLFAIFILSTVNAQIRIGKAVFPYEIMFQDSTELKLNGGGIRELLWIDLYSGGLYLAKKRNEPTEILEADETLAIRLHIVSKFVTQEKMIAAVQDGFQRVTFGNTKGLDKRIVKFTNFFSDAIIKNDVFELVYLKDIGIKAFKNGKELGLVEGRDFKYALFKIWLGEEPASGPVKLGMLGF